MNRSIYEQARDAIAELCEVAKLKPGNIVVVGCSTSEVMGSTIGTNSNNIIVSFFLLCFFVQPRTSAKSRDTAPGLIIYIPAPGSIL